MPFVPDPAQSAELVATYQAARRVLGPTADYLGESLRDFVERRADNVRRIFSKADALLTDEQEAAGAVPPRVLRGILDEGSFCDDELGQSYFAGVLASSRSDDHRDGRGATMTALIGRLSTYEIRTHYILYAHARARLLGQALNLGIADIRASEAKLFLPVEAWVSAMGFSEAEMLQISDVLSDPVGNLSREALIEPNWAFGPPETTASVMDAPTPSQGIVYVPSPLGIRLFVWVHGVRHQSPLPLLGRERLCSR